MAGSAAAQNAAQDPGAASAARLLEHIRVLSSDEFEGRAPGTPGEDKAVAYMVQEFTKLGLKPGNPDGTYIQNVPMEGILSTTTTSFQVADKTITPLVLNDYVAVSRHIAPHVEVKDSDIVFVGYGVVAPEYGWDDFKGVDVRGKTVVMLINDPPVRDPKDPTKLDDPMFKGKAMTYYGRWTYKYEEASAKGAAACLIVHETGPGVIPSRWYPEAGAERTSSSKAPTATRGGSRSRAGSRSTSQSGCSRPQARTTKRSRPQP